LSQAALRVVAALFTAQEAARVLHVSTATVYRLCAQSKLPHVRVSNAIRIAPTDLTAFIARRRRSFSGQK
jgi:excisionase family DNA binding protein